MSQNGLFLPFDPPVRLAMSCLVYYSVAISLMTASKLITVLGYLKSRVPGAGYADGLYAAGDTRALDAGLTAMGSSCPNVLSALQPRDAPRSRACCS